MQTISISEKEKIEFVSVTAGEHIIGEFTGDKKGRSLVVIGSLHGNEPSALIAMRRIVPRLAKLKDKIRGRIYFLAGNTRALSKNERYIDTDLNRHWTFENIERNASGSTVSANCSEDVEQRELLKIFDGIFSTAQDEVFALDLHSTSAESKPFGIFGDTLRNRDFALKIPATLLLGIEEILDGTILEYINNLGAVTFGFEAGQHSDKTAVENQEALIWLALANAGILQKTDFDYEHYFRKLKANAGGRRIIEIRHRQQIEETDKFKMQPGYKNFQVIEKGEFLAEDRNGRILAGETGLILMPLYQKQGSDGFFTGREFSARRLRLSKLLRKLKLAEFVRFLPGIKRHPSEAETLTVNTRIARFFPLQILHLLGFRKKRWKNDKLIVSRRKFDTKSPFVREEEVVE